MLVIGMAQKRLKTANKSKTDVYDKKTKENRPAFNAGGCGRLFVTLPEIQNDRDREQCKK